uniref:hypothetical protein n=1 Tax=Sandaracinus sp. TaxID=2024858 RepID=UPI0019D4BE16|nr:hypothetical protein [Sandaracinus sp.]
MLPQLQCAFELAPPGDPNPSALAILHTPLVAELGIAAATAGDPSRPSIVYVASYDYDEMAPGQCVGYGVLRILDARDVSVSGSVERRASELAGHSGDRRPRWRWPA